MPNKTEETENPGQLTIFDYDLVDCTHQSTILLDFASTKLEIAEAMDLMHWRLNEPDYRYVDRILTYSRQDLRRDALHLLMRSLEAGIPVYVRNFHLRHSPFY